MRHKVQSYLLAVGLALALPALILARTPAAEKSVKGNVVLSQPLKLGNQTLAPGEYTVSGNANKISVMKNGKVVAEAPVQWVASEQKYDSDSIVHENSEIREFHFKGKADRLVIQSSTAQGN